MEPTNNFPIKWLRPLSEFTKEFETPELGQVVRSSINKELYTKDSIVNAVSMLEKRIKEVKYIYGELGYKPERPSTTTREQVRQRHATIHIENTRHAISDIKVVDTESGMIVEGMVHLSNRFINDFALSDVKFGMRSFTTDTLTPDGEPLKQVNQIVCWDIIDASPAKLKELITKHPINGEWLEGFH